MLIVKKSFLLAMASAWVVIMTGGAASARQNAEPTPPLFPFVLPWDDASAGVTNMSGLIEKPAGKQGPIQARDGHFFAGDSRIRFFGVNLCFGGNFPTHDEADQIAARMAKFGINCVRFHHMDTSVSPSGLLEKDRLTIDPERLERLDYLIARLKEHGIYSNLNLHVGKPYPGLPTWEDMPNYGKGVDNFDPAMISQQKNYARALLNHVNPYTRYRYAEEPAVAIVEINNENALWHEWSNGSLDDMPAHYSNTLQAGWNDFLAQKYGDDTKLKAAWNVKEEPTGQELLKNRGFAQGLQAWNLEMHSGQGQAQPKQEAGSAVLQVVVTQPAQQNWHIQLSQAGLELRGGKPFTLSFRARTDAPFSMNVNAMQAHEPWRQLWSTQAKVTTDWQEFRYVFQPSEDDSNGRITFSGMGARAGILELAEVSLVPGGVSGLNPGEKLGGIAWLTKGDFASRTAEAQRDWVHYLWRLESRYWSGMHDFLKQELGVKAVVLGTQMGWSPAPVQAKLDAIDSHSYWQHPHFPRRPWDLADWTIKNIPMAGRPDGGTLPRLALSRVVGMPFLCTEYNHSAPNTYGSEAFLLLASFASRQDWDAIFAFAYSHRPGEWDAGRITSFFDIDQNPVKMATLPAAVAMFLRGDVPRAAKSVIARPKPEDWLEAGRSRGAWGLNAEAFGTSPQTALQAFVGLALDDAAAAKAFQESSEPQDDLAAFHWTAAEGQDQGGVTIDTMRSKAVIGSTKLGPSRLKDVTITPGPNRQDWAAITLTAIDGADFRAAGRILITATGLAENQGMKWQDAEKTSVGRDWGERPSMVEGIPATITLPVAASRARAWPLDERGQRRTGEPLRIEPDGEGCRLTIGPASRTLWYEVEVSR